MYVLLAFRASFPIRIHFNLTYDRNFLILVARFTWKHSQALDYLSASGLHGDPVVAHQERKHDQCHKLAGVGLQSKDKEQCMG